MMSVGPWARAGLLAAAAVGAGAAAASLVPEHPVLVQFRVERDTVSLHRPFVLEFSVRNDLSEPVALDLGADFVGAFRFGLTDPDHQTVETRPSPGGAGPDVAYVSGRASVGPGEEYRQRLILNEWLRFGVVGAYELTVALPTGIRLADGTSLPTQSASFRLQVGPRDPAALENYCAALAVRAEVPGDAEGARSAELELSYVDDPVAVPYLARTLAVRNHLEGAVVAGLERIGDEDAVDVLIQTLADKRTDARIFARQALGRLESRIPDPFVKARIRQALGNAGPG